MKVQRMRILFGVFDWGLGHATRDIPLIEGLLLRGHAVHIVSTGRALALLRQHFGTRCEYFDVPSIGNPYTKTKLFLVSFIMFAPRMIRNLSKAHRIVEGIIAKGKYDKVISDCRYDVYDKVGNSYLINHQIRFKAFAGGERIAEHWLARQQSRYRYIMVPDFEKGDLTGELSHGLKIVDRRRVKYIGVLSCLRKRQRKKDIDYFISISGPEPQRTMLERILFRQVGKLHGNVVVTLGKPEVKRRTRKGRVTVCGFLSAKQQEDAMNRAKCVITRAGYTTIMDLYELGVRRALIIPTPGQTEQEYLARLYERRHELHFVSQGKLNLSRDIALTDGYSGFAQHWRTKESVERFMKVVLDR